MFGKLLVGLVLIGSGILAIRVLSRASTLAAQQKKHLDHTTEDLVRCPQCGIYYQPDAGCIHCQNIKTDS